MSRASKAVAILAMLVATTDVGRAQSPNEVLGTWRMVSATIEREGDDVPAYGARPNGMLVFTPDMHFVEVLTDADVPKFASNVRGEGTPKENAAAMAGGIGFFGTYTVDANGVFSGNRVEGSTFPNWVGGVRTSRDLNLRVVGNRMFERFQRPDATRVSIVFERLR
ncbi:lipocalin-like domain-containing protein [Aureimonas phyllosphaerae]|uniref:lipocalin-like domain-containing protein n=1 Tax=Aureimonas phyllosphaerae TaxID=1166078 RepID=UPI003A5C6E39